MASAYAARFAYGPDTFGILASLRRGSGPVCEIGAGNGRLTLGLAGRVGRVDAIEPSRAMVDAAGEGANPDIHWIVARFEEAPLRGPYSLVVAAESIHWVDWKLAFPRIVSVLIPGAFLALVGVDEFEPGTDDPSRVRCAKLRQLINEFSTNHEYERYDLIPSLSAAGVFELVGTARATRATVTESIERVISRLHSMNGLAPTALGHRLGAFDRRARDLLLRLAPTGTISTDIRPIIWWGYPRAGA
jgi:ubiquinone/menaquinone biosynthesis C-methylase UbiE